VVERELSLRFSWDPALLQGVDIERLAGHLQTLLLDAVAHPDKRLFELALLRERELGAGIAERIE